MIDLELVKENKPIELELEENSKGGTNNYNELENKPQINGKTLQGNLTLEDLGIIVNAVKDILINGASIIDKNGNAVIPVLGDGEHNVGLVRLYAEDVKSNGGLLHWATSGPRKGCLTVNVATEQSIDKRWNNPIGANRLPYAVKSAMSSVTDAEWTPQEKANARARMGEEWRYIGKVETQEDVARMTMALDENGKPFSLRKVRILFKNMPNQSNSANVVRLELNGVSQPGLIQPLGVKTTETARFSFYEIELFNNQPFVNQYFESLNSTTNNQYMQNKPSNRMVGETTLKEIQSITSVALIVPGGANAIGSGAYMEVWGVDA